MFNILLTLVLGLNTAAAQSKRTDPEITKFCKSSSPAEKRVTVTRIGDGDTLTVEDEEARSWRVRMNGIDTPESWYKEKSQGPWAKKAREYLKSRVAVGSKVTLTFERKACDGFKRLIARVLDGSTDINREMIVKGYAVNYCIAPNTDHCADYGFEAQKNMDQKIGIFSDPDLKLPYIWRQEAGDEEMFSYWIGDIETKDVIPSERMEEIPLGRRVFFYSKFWIRSPYKIAE